MSDDQDRREDGRGAAALVVPDAVQEAWQASPQRPAAGQVRRALWGDITRFVVVLNTEGEYAEVAPLSLDPDLASDEAYRLEAGESDLGVEAAVWLGLKTTVPIRVLERSVGAVHIPVDSLRKLPAGTAIRDIFDPRADERAVLADDMDELAAAPAAEPSLKDLLANVSGADMRAVGLAPQLVLALRRGQQAVTPEQAELLAPLAGVTAEALLTSNPALPEDLVADLDSAAGRRWVAALAEERQLSVDDARRNVGYGAYALAAREQRGRTVWIDRIEHYVRSRLTDG
jgi:hypothetical protein